MYEISRKSISIAKYEETDIKWQDFLIVIRGNKDLHLLEFSYNLQSLDKKIEFKECTVSCVKDNPVTNNYLRQYVSNGVENVELVEMVTDSAFWPHNRLLTNEMTKIVAYQLSPSDLIANNDSVLAVVNSVGNVEFFVPKRLGWICIYNFSIQMKTLLNLSFDNIKNYPKNFEQIKKNVYNIETATLCWASELNDDGSCYLVTAQKSGQILFWSVKYCESNFKTDLCGSIQDLSDMEIVMLKWIFIDENKFLLLCSNENGQVICHECEIKNNNILHIKEQTIWTYKDKMVATHINYYLEQDKLLLFFNKHRHLVVQMYNKKLALLSQHVQIVNDCKITSISNYESTFYLTTFNSVIFKINYIVTNDNLKVSLEVVETKDCYSNHEMFGLSISKNSAIIAIAIVGRQLLHRKESLKIDIVLLSSHAEFDNDVLKIMSNPSKNIAKIWDYVEILRCKIIKAKKLPTLDYDSLLKEGETDVYKLKVYLIFLHFYHNLERRITPGLKGLMPETSIDVIKDRILVHQAVTQISNLHQHYQSNSTLSSFEWECFHFSKIYLQTYCKKYKKSPSDFVSDNIISMPMINKLNVKHLCQNCDENLIDFSCKNNHLNVFCSLTFTPIEDDYLVCKSCNAVARKELYHENPTCVYCDLCLITSI